MDMRILVLGAGAVGGYFGGRLAEAGRDVTFLVRGPRAAALAETASRSTARSAISRAGPGYDRRPVGGPYDLVLLTAKHYDLDAAIDAIVPGSVDTACCRCSTVSPPRPPRGRVRAGARARGVAYVGAVLVARRLDPASQPSFGIAFGERAGGSASAPRRSSSNSPAPRSPPRRTDNILWRVGEVRDDGRDGGMNCLLRAMSGESSRPRRAKG